MTVALGPPDEVTASEIALDEDEDEEVVAAGAGGHAVAGDVVEITEVPPIPWNLQTTPSQQLGREIGQWLSGALGLFALHL